MKPAAETELPRWHARDQREREQMFRWMFEKLNEARARRQGVPLTVWLKSDAAAQLAAWHGNMRPLRAKYPHLAPFLHPPKLRRGHHLRKNPGDALRQAVEDVKLIRQIWKKYYPRKIRHHDDGPSAAEIAACRCRFSKQEDIDIIERRANKPSGAHKTPQRAHRGKTGL